MRERDLEKTGRESKKLTKEELYTVEKQFKDNYRRNSCNVREALLDRSTKDSYPEDVAFRAGDVFSDVVFSCLGGDFDSFREANDEVGLQNMFQQKILKPLDSIRG